MAKMIVELEWDDSMGEHWMNIDNLAILLYTDQYVKREHLSAIDITQQYQINSRKSEVLSKVMMTHDL
jgi:hypothetical protein